MNRIMKSFVPALIVLVLGTSTLVAGNKNRVATAGAQELLIPVTARGIALGGASIAMSSGLDALFYNPAGVAHSAYNVDAGFSSMSYFADINVNYGAVVAKAGSIGTFALSLKSLSFGDIPVTTEDFPDGTGELYSPSFVNVGLTYSNQISDRVSAGVTATIISEKIMSTSASGVAFDFGVQYRGLGVSGLSLGVAIKNVGTQLKFAGANLVRPGTINDATRNTSPNWYAVNTAGVELPTSIEIGLGYQQSFDENNGISLMTNFQSNNFSDDEFKLGAEYTLQKMFYVRGGYSLSPNATEDLAGEKSYMFGYTLGGGLQFDLSGVNARVDYAFQSMKYFDGNNVFTVSFGF